MDQFNNASISINMSIRLITQHQGANHTLKIKMKHLNFNQAYGTAQAMGQSNKTTISINMEALG